MTHNNILFLKYIINEVGETVCLRYEYVCIPDKVNNLTTERLITLSEMIYISIDHSTIYCHSRYSMNRKYEYTTDKIYNLIGNEGNKY